MCITPKGQIVGQQPRLPIDGRPKPIGQIDQGLLNRPTEDMMPDEVILMDLDEEYSQSETRRSAGPSARRSSRRSTQHDSCERASHKRVPCASERRTTRTARTTSVHVSDYVHVSEYRSDGGEAPSLVAGMASMLNLRARRERHGTEGYNSVMDLECVPRSHRQHSNATNNLSSGTLSNGKALAPALAEHVPVSSHTSEGLPTSARSLQDPEVALSSALQVCDDSATAKEILPVPPSEPRSSKASLQHLRHWQTKSTCRVKQSLWPSGDDSNDVLSPIPDGSLVPFPPVAPRAPGRTPRPFIGRVAVNNSCVS